MVPLDVVVEKAMLDQFLARIAIEDKGDDPKAKKDAKKPGKKDERKKDMMQQLKNNFNTRLLKIMIEV